MSDLYGKNRVVLIEEIKHAYSISYQNGSLYFSEWFNFVTKALKLLFYYLYDYLKKF